MNDGGEVHPLDGLLVVDLSTGIPGAYCAKQLADGGAEVVRLELPEGEPLRRWSHGGAPEDGDGALFRFLACSTRSVVVAPGTTDGELVERLLAAADVVVWSPGSGVGSSPGMAPEQLHARFPAAIVVAITPFGLTGPWAGQPASDLTLQAWAGAANLGNQWTPPAQWGGRVGLWLGGVYAAVGVLAARRRQATTGVGDLLDVSLLEAIQFSVGTYQVTRRTMSPPERLAADDAGPKRSVLIPMIERTRDGWVGFMVATARMWEAFSILVEHPEWADDESLYPYAGRAARRDELEGAIREWTARHTTAEVLHEAALLRVPAAPIGTGATVADIDHFVARRAHVPSPSGSFRQPDVAYRFSGRAAPRPFAPAPALGADTDAERQRPRVAKPAAGHLGELPLPLAGMRAIDFTAYWAGPVVGSFLAMMGADVIHVESPRHPDGIRGHPVHSTAHDRWWEWSAHFHGPNTNKRDVTIDMTSERGRELALRLIAECDVMLENYSPRVMEHWGLEYEAVRAVRPDILFLRMPAFGLTGPWRDRNGYAQTMEQSSGMAWVTGFPDGPPQVLSGTCDPLAGAHATVALLLALEHRARTGEGMQVEVAMVGGALNVAAEQLLEHDAYGRLLERAGNRGVGAPQNLYLTSETDAAGRRDEWVAIAVETDEQWRALRKALGEPAWALDPAFDTEAGRRAAHDLLDARLTAWCADRRGDEIVSILWPAGVPVARVMPARESDGLLQHRARGFYEPVEHPLTGTQLHIRYPVRFAAGPARLHRAPAPMLGQHNREILQGLLGLTDQELADLEAAEVIGTRLLGDHKTRS